MSKSRWSNPKEKALAIARLNRNTAEMLSVLTSMPAVEQMLLLVNPAYDILRDAPAYESFFRSSPFGIANEADIEAVVKAIE